MTNKLTPIRIFISSPGDLSKEREVVRAVVAELNESPYYNNKYKFIAYTSEGSTPVLVEESPQIVVDKFLLLPHHADILVCMLWLRMGTPTSGLIDPDTGQSYQSRTEYEFLTAYRAKQGQDQPLILLYRYTQLPESLDTLDLNQYERVKNFFARFKPGGDLKSFVTEIKDAIELHKVLRNDLERLLAYEISQTKYGIYNNGSHQKVTSNPVYFLPDNLPSEYVPRTQVLDDLRHALLGGRSTIGVVDTTALHGQGGLGKTTLARAICDDPVIRGAFPDGILWARLGQEAEPVPHQRHWITALGGNVSAASSIESGKVELWRLLKDRSILLVLDDVWDISNVQALNVGGQGCHLLITTRDATQIESATIVPLKQMRNQESHALLRISSDNTIKDETLLDAIAERLGHLPLALIIVGAMLRRGILWEDILSALNEGDMKFVRYGQRSVQSAIATSVAHLDDEHQQRYKELIVFPKDQPLVIEAVIRLWNRSGNLSPREVRQLIVEFRDQALLQTDTTLHDLQYDFLQSVVSKSEQRRLHSLLADAFQQPDWSTLRIEGNQNYGLQHFAYHLFQAGRLNELESLLTDYVYLRKKIEYLGTASLMNDFSFINSVELFHKIADALEISAHVLDHYPKQLYNQLFGRIGYISELYNISIEVDPFIRLESPTLTSPYRPLLSNLDGHIGGLKGCAFVPENRYVLSASIDGTLRLWDIETGRSIRTFEGHRGAVNDCAVSADGKYILSASADCTLRIWNIDTGHLERIFEGHSDTVTCCQFSSDSQLVLSGSADKTLRLWDMLSGRTIQVFEGHKNSVKGCAINDKQGLIFSGSSDHTVKIWDIISGVNLYTLEGHTGEVAGIAFAQATNILASSSYDGTVRIWDIKNQKLIDTFKTHSSGVLDVEFIPDGQTILCGSWDRTLKSWSVKEGHIIREYLGHKGGINSCAVSADGTLALSASWDSTLRLWNISTGEEIKVFEGYIGRVSSCAFSPNGSYAVSSYGDGTINLWEVSSRKIIRTLKGHTNYVRGCVFSPNGLYVASTSEDQTIRLWNIETGSLIQTFKGHTGPTRDCVFTPDGKFIISASWDNTLRLWNIGTGESIGIFMGHRDHVNGLSIDKIGAHLISVSDDKTLRLWELATGKTISVLEGHIDYIRSCDLNHDATLALSSSIDGTIYLWDLKKQAIKHILKKHTLYVRSCKFSNDGNIIFSVSDDGTLRLWNTETGIEITSWLGDGALMCCAIHPFANKIIVGDGLGNVHFLQLENV